MKKTVFLLIKSRLEVVSVSGGKDKIVFDDFIVGYTGGIRLIEDIYTVASQRFN